MLFAEGRLIHKTKYTIKPQDPNKEAFDVHTLFIANGDNREPVRIKAGPNAVKALNLRINEQIRVPFFVKPWNNGNRSGFELVAINPKS